MKKHIRAILLATTTLLASALLFSLNLNAQVVWQQTNGPSGGSVQSVVAAPDDVVYANFHYYPVNPALLEVYRSENRGVSWELTSISKPVFSADNYGNIYSVIHSLLPSDPDTVFRSTNGGDSWTAVLDGEFAITKLLDAGNGKLFFTGTNLYMSEDQGATWTLMNSGDNFNVALNSQGHLMKALQPHLLISQDDGATWSVFADISQLFSGISAIAINAQDEIFLGQYSAHLYKMSADGTSLVQISDFWDIQDIDITPAGTILVMSYMGHMHVSLDNGLTWDNAMDGMISTASYTGIVTDPQGIAYATWTEGIYRSDDEGLNWVHANEGIYKSNINSFLMPNENTTLAVTDKRVFSTTNGGNTWQEVYTTGIYYTIVRSFSSNSGSMFLTLEEIFMDKKAGTNPREPNLPCFDWNCHWLLRSDDGGTTWTEVHATSYIGELAQNPQGTLFAWAGDHITSSTDDGITWDSIPSIISNARLVADSAGVIYAQTYEGYYKSEDNALTWEYISMPEYDDFTTFLDFAISNTGTLYSLTDYLSGGSYFWTLYASYDQGVSWTQLHETGTYSLNTFHIGQFNHLYLTGSEGISRSTDGGTTWQLISADIDWPVRTLTEDNTGRLFAAVQDRAVWTSDTYVDTRPQPAASNNAITIYPNPAPAGSAITISYPGAISYPGGNSSGNPIGNSNSSPNSNNTSGNSNSNNPLQLYTLEGKLLLEKHLTPTGHTTLQLQGLKPGVYQVRIGILNARLIIQ